MASDGTLKFDTRIDSKGFQAGINTIGDIAQKGLQATVDILKGAAAAIGGLGVAAIKVGSDFESGMSKVAAISGATGQDLIDLTEKAKEMGASTKFSATESAAAFEYMAMAGWKTADMLDGIGGIMNLAAASGEDLATTSDIVTDALTAFGMAAGDAGHFSDILAQASSNANTNVGMMGETFKYVAPVAGALGYTAEDTAMAIGLMANAGIKSSQAGTSLRSMMSRLVTETGEAGKAITLLGLSLTDEEGDMYSWMEVMEQMRQGFKGGRITQEEYNEAVKRYKQLLDDGAMELPEYTTAMEALDIALNGTTEAQQAEIAAMLAGQEAMSGLLAIVNASDDDFSKLAESIYNCDGAAAQMAETMNDNLQGQLTILKSGLEGLGISFYEQVQTPLKDIAIEAQGMVQQLQDAFNEDGLTGLVTAFGDVLAQIVERAAGAAPELINAATGLVSSFCDSLKSSTGIGEAASSLITSLVTALFGCADDIWTTAIVLVGKMAQGIADGAPEMVQSVATCVTNIFECLSEWAPDFVDAGVQIIGSIAQGLADTLPIILQQGIDMVLELGRGIAKSLPSLIPLAVDGILNLIDTFVNNIDSIVDVGIEIVMAIAEGIIRALPVLIQKAPVIIAKLWDALNKNLAKILIAIVTKIDEWKSQLREAFSNAVGNCIDVVTTWFSELPDKIGTWLTEVVNQIVTWGAEMLSSAGEAASSMISGVVVFFSELPGKIWTWLLSTVTKVAQFAVNLKTKGTAAAQGFISNLVDGVKALPDKFKEIGSNIVTGIWDGISSGWNWLVDKVKGIADSLFKGAKDALGINSPSKVFAQEVGQWIPPGIGVGMEKAMPDLQDQVDAEMEDLANRMQTAVAIETGGITVRTRSNAEHNADTEYPACGGDTYLDQHIEQENNYHVPVATPSETSKAQREAARKLLGGVK